MLSTIFLILFPLAAVRSIVRFGKARRISDGLFAFFWLSLAAAMLLDSRVMTLIPLVLLVAASIAKSKDSDAVELPNKESPLREDPEPFQLSEPPPAASIGRPADRSKQHSHAPSPSCPEKPEESEPLIPLIPELAEQCVVFGKIKNRVFDYSPTSLDELDALISEEWGEQEPLFPNVTTLQVGSYVGETFRREFGGNWEETEDRGVHLAKVGRPDIKAFPFTKARKRILDGEGDSLAFFYRALKQTIEKDSSADEKS